MKTYPEKMDEIGDVELFKKFNNCVKKPIVIQAIQMTEEFRVQAMEGDYKLGKSGDYLMSGIEGELYICDKNIFEKSYDFVK